MIQLNKPLTIVIGILALGAIIFNFYENPDVSHLLGKEVNNWLYRGFWLLIVGICIYNYIVIDRNTLKNKSKRKLPRGSVLKPSPRDVYSESPKEEGPKPLENEEDEK